MGIDVGVIKYDGGGSFFETCVAYVVDVGLAAHWDRFSFVLIGDNQSFEGLTESSSFSDKSSPKI